MANDSEKRPSSGTVSALKNFLDTTTVDIERQDTNDSSEPYSVHGRVAKGLITLTVSVAGCFSPLATTMYLPAFDELSRDLNQSIVLINLSMTTYLILQGLAPALLGTLMDQSGRRPIYILCFVIYIASNVGLALQNNYAGFLVLRAVQSAGSSSTIALASAVITDISTTSERGKAMGYAFSGFLSGQTLSPVLGGILTNYLGWRWIFWFLAIFAGVFFVILLLFLPETARALVGNGDRRPPRSSMCLLDVLPLGNKPTKLPLAPKTEDGSGGRCRRLCRSNPFAALRVFRDKAVFLVLLANGINFCGSVAVTTSQPTQFKAVYNLNDLNIGLCFLPFGIGGIVASFAQGWLTDWNYRRHARRYSNSHEQQTTSMAKGDGMSKSSLVRARGEMLPPLAVLQCVSAIAYAWMLQYSVHLAGPLVILFLIGYTSGAMINCLNVLTTDLCDGRPATAMAMTNMMRCLLGAAASAAIGPFINAAGRGWALTTLPGFTSLFCIVPVLIAIYLGGRKASHAAAAQQERSSSP